MSTARTGNPLRKRRHRYLAEQRHTPEAAQLTPSPSSEPARMGIAAAATAMTWGSLLKAIASWRRSNSATPIRVRQLISVMMPVISVDRRANLGLPRVAQHCQQ